MNNRCFLGQHIWNKAYDGSSERHCLACGHLFVSDDAEKDNADDAIELSSNALLSKSKQSLDSPRNFSRSIVRRRG